MKSFKQFVFVAAIALSGLSANAQVKVGNNPTVINASSMLEVESTNKGLLYPRVALTSTTGFAPLASHVAGMTVYNTATAGDVIPGLYVNDGTKWEAIVVDVATVKVSKSLVTIPAFTKDLSGGLNWVLSVGTGSFQKQSAFSFNLLKPGAVTITMTVDGGIPCDGCVNDQGVIDNDYMIATGLRCQILDGAGANKGESNIARGYVYRNFSGHKGASSSVLLLKSGVLPAGLYTIEVQYTMFGDMLAQQYQFFNGTSNMGFLPGSASIVATVVE